ncbi:unnamed protein product [Ectocarpus sp. 12 AP-2014]
MPAIEMLADPNYSMVITAGVAAVAFVSAATFVRSSQAAKKRKKEDEGKARRASATLKLRFVAWVQTAVAAEESNALDTLEVHLDTECVELDVQEAKTRETTHRAEKEEKRLATTRRSHAQEIRALMEDVRLGEILQGRLEGQLEAERDVREIRKKRFKGDVAAAKERAKAAELTLATISGLVKIEQQENVQNLKAENERRQAEVRSRVAFLQLVPPSLQRPPDSGLHVNPEGELDGSQGVEELLLASPAAITDTMAAATGARSTFALDGEETSSIAAAAGADSSADAPENGLEEFGSCSEWDEEIDEHQQEEREQTQQQQQQQQRELVDQMSAQREGEEEQERQLEQMSTQQEEEKEQKRNRRRYRRRLHQEQQYKRDLKLMFLRNVAETSRELSVSVPAMHLARWCSLRPSSRALRRGQVLNEGAFGAVTVVQHEAHGSFALKEVSSDAAKEVGRAAMQEVHILIDLMGHDNIIGLKSFDLTIRSMPILMELATCDAFDVLEGGYFYSVLQKAKQVDRAKN